MSKLTLFGYQREAVDAIKADWVDGHKDVLLVMATGGGKTHVFLQTVFEMLEEHPDLKRVMIMAHLRELIYQPVDRISQFWPHWFSKTGVVMAHHDQVAKDVIVGTIQTLSSSRRLDAILDHGPIDMLIHDEAHHSVSETSLGLIERLREANPHLLHLGVTATPKRADGVGLRKVYSKTSYQIGLRELILLRRLAPPRWLAIQTGVKLSEPRQHCNPFGEVDYSNKEIADAYEVGNVFDIVVESHKKFAAERQSIAFTASVRGAHSLAQKFNDAGIKAAAADGTTANAERDQILRDAGNGRIQVLVNCLDSETEILTRRGWVGMDDIREDDITAAVNSEVLDVSWEPISRVVRRKRAPGERMVRIRNRSVDIRVTEGHRLMFRTRGTKKWKLEEAVRLPDHVAPYQFAVSTFAEPEAVCIPEVPEILTRLGRRSGLRYDVRQRDFSEDEIGARLDAVAERRQGLRYKKPHELSSDECGFIGLFMSDGHLADAGRGIEISRPHRTVEANTEIVHPLDPLDGCGFAWVLATSNTNRAESRTIRSAIGQNVYRVPGGAVGGELTRYGFLPLTPYLDKDFSDLLFGLNRDQVLAVVQGLWLGDGQKNNRPSKGKAEWRIDNTNKEMLDKLQILCSLRGLATYLSPPRKNGGMATKPIYTLHVRDRCVVATNNHTMATSGGNPALFEEDWRDEEVWCVTNKTGTIITRRGGRVVVMGQCAIYTEGLDLPMVSCIHMVRPTKSNSLYTQAIGRALRTYPGKSDALILDYSPLEHRDLANMGDVLGATRRQQKWIAAVNPGEVQAGLTFHDGGRLSWLVGDPNEIITRSLDYLNLSPWRWHRGDDGWSVLGMGKGVDEIERTLALSPLGETMSLWAIWNDPKHQGRRAAKVMESDNLNELQALADEYCEKHAVKMLAAKKQGWHSDVASAGQIRFGRKLGCHRAGMTKGELSAAINRSLTIATLRQHGALQMVRPAV